MRRFNAVLFDDIASEILARYRASPNRRTYVTSRAPVNHLLKTFGGMLIKTISPDDFWLIHVPRARAELPNRNLNNDLKLFKQVLFVAHRRGIIRFPPTRIKRPSPENAVGKEIPRDHIDLFLKYAPPRVCLQIEISLITGMRLREMLRLKWDYIHFGSGIVSLPPEITKTARGRSVSLGPVLLEKIKKRKKEVDREWVFPSPVFPWQPQDNNKGAWSYLKKIIHNKEGVSLEYRWHDWRVTSATLKVRAHVPEAIIARTMGMSSGVLRRIYHQVNEKDVHDASLAIDSVIKR